jgi:monoamine oxidase
MKNADVIIIGAGASGLAAAYELSRNNVKVLLLEARDRIGGRVHTLNQRGLPVELGAEYMHGTPKSTLALAEKTHTAFVDANFGHFYLKDGKLQQLPDFWNQIEEVISRVDKNRPREFSVAEFLKHEKLDPEIKNVVAGFVQGFHAADLTLMGERTLQESEDDPHDNLQGTHNFRFPRGYSTLINKFLKYIPEESLCLNTVVEKITWTAGEAKLNCYNESGEREFTTPKLIVTLPLGVLKAKSGDEGAIEWSPNPPESLTKALSAIEMGHVQRLTLRFKTRFWEKLSETPIGFLHPGDRHYFARFWTTMPLRFPQLVAWEGGPKALEMSKWDDKAVVQKALQSLSAVTGKSVSFLESELVQSFRHDWNIDPFTKGAYSYIRVGGEEDSKLMAWPIEDTIFFAGEATASGEARGTVHGAIDSGLRAAKQILSRIAH